MNGLDAGCAYPSCTYEFTSPDGDAYVTIADTGESYWINAVVGFAGTTVAADAYAIGKMAGHAIRAGAAPRDVALALVGVTHKGSNSLTQDALSVPDAVGKAILRHLEACQAG